MKSRKTVYNFIQKNIIIISISTLCLTYILIANKRELEPRQIVHYLNFEHDANIDCYNDNADKGSDSSLPVSDHEKFPSDSIYFLETSCKGGINSRQACCVESAARSNPRRQINLIFTGIVTKLFTKSATPQSLLQYKNVRISRIHPAQYVRRTPVESLFTRKVFSESKFQVEHTADVLRVLTLYKHGGIYLDTDVIVTKSFDTLPKNWLAKESVVMVSSAILALSTDEVGNIFTTAALQLLNSTYDPSDWTFNGPELITRVLTKWCNTSDVTKMNETMCPGISVFAPQKFFPVPYWHWNEYFASDSKKRILDEPYTFHFNNKLSKNAKISNDSFIARLAKKYCPVIYDLYNDDFGN